VQVVGCPVATTGGSRRPSRHRLVFCCDPPRRRKARGLLRICNAKKLFAA